MVYYITALFKYFVTESKNIIKIDNALAYCQDGHFLERYDQ